MAERLQRIIARAGITSRRKAEVLISEGRVAVNGAVVRELGSKADPVSDTISVDGKPIPQGQERRYLALNKPRACVTTTSDPEGRLTVMDLLGRQSSTGLFPVGRLDYNTEGLLLVTNDGDFANQVTAAKNRVPKTYHVKVSGLPAEEAVQRLRTGIRLDGRFVKPESIRMLRMAQNPWYEITLVGGRNRQLHRMFERIGHLVGKIRRVSIGNLTLRGLEPRQVRELTSTEVHQLANYEPSRRPPRPETKERKPKRRPGRPRVWSSRGQSSSRARSGNRRVRPSSAGRPRGAGQRNDRSRDNRRRNDRRRDDRRRDDRRRGQGNSGRPVYSGRPARRKSATGSFRRSSRPRQQPRRRRPSGADSPVRGGPRRRAMSPRHRPAQSRGRRSSPPRTRARP